MLLGALALPGVFSASAAETTLYVNNFFEVREHDQPVKYIFNGDTRVALSAGSLSANTRIQRFRLYPGWNLLSLAVTATNGLRQMTNSQFSILNSQSVFRWDPPAQTWQRVPPDDTLPGGTVLWLHASTNTTLALTGTYSDPTNRPIAIGGSFLPSAGLEALPLLGESAGVRADLPLWHFGSSRQSWQLSLPAVPFVDSSFPGFLAPGDAVYVKSEAPSELKIPEAALRVRYYHQDHLGSSSVMTDAQGALVEETAFYPFGVARHEHRLRQVEEDYKFTQKERDRESGLQYFGRRFYAPALGKWLSTDPMEEKGGSLNLYAYAIQNPLKYHDPDGAEIDVTTTSDKKTGVTTHNISVTAVIQDVPEAHSDKPRSAAELEAFRGALGDTIKKEYSYYDKESKTRWVADAKIKVLGPGEKPGPKDHVFQLVGSYGMKGVGETRFEMQPDGTKHRGMVMKIQVRALLDARSSELRGSPHYKSPESIAAHELGHAGGLDDLETDHKNLMSHGRQHDSREIKVEQLRRIVSEFQKGHLNKPLK